MKNFLTFVFLIFFLSSCVSNYKNQLFQKDDVNRKDLVKNSVVRTYEVGDFNYKIQTNDILSVKIESLTPKEFDVFKMDQANAGLASPLGALISGELVDDLGQVRFPVVGKVKVAGKTIDEIQNELLDIASKYLEAPIVKVRLLNYRVSFFGEVNKEGTVALSNNRVSIIEALGMAGGFNDLANRANVKLIRQNGNKTEVIYLNFLTEDIMKSPYFYVHQNDVFVVPPLKQRPYTKYFNNNLGSVVTIVSLVFIYLTLSKN